MGSLADKDGETSDGNTKDASNANTNINNNNIVRVQEGELIQGILVTQNFNSKILPPEICNQRFRCSARMPSLGRIFRSV